MTQQHTIPANDAGASAVVVGAAAAAVAVTLANEERPGEGSGDVNMEDMGVRKGEVPWVLRPLPAVGGPTVAKSLPVNADGTPLGPERQSKYDKRGMVRTQAHARDCTRSHPP